MNLKDLSPEELRGLVVDMGFEGYRANQLLFWLYKRPVSSFEEMTNLPRSLREELSRRFVLYSLQPVEKQISWDGTYKYLFKALDGDWIESVLIPDADRKTLCISTQIGCRMGCKFCLTGQQGFKRNLTPSEIIDQVIIVSREHRIDNIVLMGMGEPLDNLDNTLKALRLITHKDAMGISPRRITLSTVGLIPELKNFLEERVYVVMSVSANAADSQKRASIMPVEKRYPLAEVVNLLRKYRSNFSFRKPPTFEYVLLKDYNDADEDALNLAELLKGLRCKVNLIPFNPWPEAPFQRPDMERVLRFQSLLRKRSIPTFIRKSKGQDILAACGQLRWRHISSAS